MKNLQTVAYDVVYIEARYKLQELQDNCEDFTTISFSWKEQVDLITEIAEELKVRRSQIYEEFQKIKAQAIADVISDSNDTEEVEYVSHQDEVLFNNGCYPLF